MVAIASAELGEIVDALRQVLKKVDALIDDSFPLTPTLRHEPRATGRRGPRTLFFYDP